MFCIRRFVLLAVFCYARHYMTTENVFKIFFRLTEVTMSQSVTGRHSDFIAANSFRKLASSRDRFDDPDLNVGYSQLLPSTKYWAPGKLPQYLETNERYDKCPRDEEVENDYSLTTTYDMDHSDNLRASPIRRHSSRTTRFVVT